MAFSRCTGLGIACFEVGRFAEAADWWTRLMHEHPSAAWANRFRAPALLFAGKKDEAERSFQDLRRMYPSLTIRDVQGSLPHTQAYMDNACNGLESLGLQLG